MKIQDAVARAFNLKPIPMFNSARLKLTFLYTLFVVLITAPFSGLIYRQANGVIRQEHVRIYDRLSQQGFLGILGARAQEQIVNQLMADYEENRKKLIERLVLINVAIGGSFAVASYFLAGKTLEPIQEALEQQKRFVGDAAHELKTPITALKTSLEVNLMDKGLHRKARKILAENLEDVESLGILTNSLVKLASVTDNKLVLKPVVLAPIVEQSVKHLKPLAAAAKIKIDVNQSDKEIKVRGDRGALTDMFNVFIDNAIKYSGAKSKISVEVAKGRGVVKISIQDQGMGIAKYHQRHIFERFYRADSARTKNSPGGYGLGLSVAEKIIEEHKGSVSLKSAVGRGTTFTIKLPLV